jgi:hypothetical protein
MCSCPLLPLFGGVVVGCGHCCMAGGSGGDLKPARVFPWIASAVVGAVPGEWGLGMHVGHEVLIGPHPCWSTPGLQSPMVPLPWLVPSSQLRTKGHDKLGVE